jgi:diguanylate cyclase (GGDEF)-like protein
MLDDMQLPMEEEIANVYKRVEALKRSGGLILCLLLLLAAGWVDKTTLDELRVMPLYLLPVIISAWFLGMGEGLFFAMCASFIWLWLDRVGGTAYKIYWIPLWNSIMDFLFFALVAFLLARLKQEFLSEKSKSRADTLTGLLNSRGFMELSAVELERARRHGHPISLAYMDLDNFKAVNDTQGHSAGDRLLKEVGLVLRDGIRRNDLAARLGGDEFAVFFPETGPDAAKESCRRLQEALDGTMKLARWPVTFSIGVATFPRMPKHLDEVLRAADNAMYAVKKKGKNEMNHVIIEVEESLIASEGRAV